MNTEEIANKYLKENLDETSREEMENLGKKKKVDRSIKSFKTQTNLKCCWNCGFSKIFKEYLICNLRDTFSKTNPLDMHVDPTGICSEYKKG